MHKVLLTGLIGLAGLCSFQFGNEAKVEHYDTNTSFKFSTGINSGASGAPGDPDCSACHLGGLQDGANQHVFSVAQNGTSVGSYIPGQTYDVTLELTTGNVLEGFQATVLDLTNDEMAGTFSTSNNGTNVIQPSGNSRQYVNHTTNSNTEGNPNWEWQWTAPATDIGPVRFYVASNIADGDWNPEDDLIFTSQYTFGSPLGTEELVGNISGFEVGSQVNNKVLAITLTSQQAEMMYLNLVDVSGKSVFTQILGMAMIGSNEEQISLPSHLESGMYVVHFFVGNNSVSSSVRIL
jgi:hypothetical protein